MKRNLFFISVAAMLSVTLGCEEKPKEPAATPATDTTPKPATNNTPPAEEPPKPATNAGTTGAVAPTGDGDFAAIDPASLNEKAPDKFTVKFATTEGDFTVELNRDWAPNGVDRFYNLVKAGYYTDIAAFRVIDGFMAQFGIHGNPAVNAKWREAKIQDDPRKDGVSNNVGYLTYAMAGPNTRTVQLFINYNNNAMLDSQGFTPIGKVQGDGMDVVRKWHAGYGEGAPRGKGPDQMKLQMQGNEYLKRDFPNLSYIKTITIEGDTGAAAAPPSKPDAPKPDAPKPAAKAWEAGGYQQAGLSGTEYENTMVRLSVKDDGTVSGTVQGTREGKGFSMPIKGAFDDKGVLTAEGSRGQNNLKVRGSFKDGKVVGSAQGTVNAKGISIQFQATK